MHWPNKFSKINSPLKYLGLVLVLIIPLLVFFVGKQNQSKESSQQGNYSSDTSIVSEPDGNIDSDMLTLDEKFYGISQQIPAFGGMYYGREGQLTFCLKDIQNEETEAVKAQIKEAFADDPRVSEAEEINIVLCKYNFQELFEWYGKITDILGIPGVVMTDIDEMKNRISIGVENQEVQIKVEKKLKEYGIPLEAVLIEVTEPIVSY